MANVHKDFHGALSYGIQYLVEHYGVEGMARYFDGLADTVYAPLVEALKAQGTSAIQEHFEAIFNLEGGEFTFREENGQLVFEVTKCPAIAHMKEQGYAIAPHFCEHTRIVNEAVCKRAGYCSSVNYDQEAGQCVQRFWKEV